MENAEVIILLILLVLVVVQMIRIFRGKRSPGLCIYIVGLLIPLIGIHYAQGDNGSVLYYSIILICWLAIWWKLKRDQNGST